MSYTPKNLKLWKRPAHYIGSEWPEFYPVIGHHRDSDILTESNFEHVRKALQAEDAGVDGFWQRSEVQPEAVIVRESCSMVGWQEWIGVRDNAEEKLRLADYLAGCMADYPVLDEDDFSMREVDAANETWSQCYTVRQRAEIIREYNEHHPEFPLSIFAARHAYIPSGESGEIFDRMRG